MLTSGLVQVLEYKSGLRWDERREGWRNDVNYPLVVREPGGEEAGDR